MGCLLQYFNHPLTLFSFAYGILETARTKALPAELSIKVASLKDRSAPISPSIAVPKAAVAIKQLAPSMPLQSFCGQGVDVRVAVVAVENGICPLGALPLHSVV